MGSSLIDDGRQGRLPGTGQGRVEIVPVVVVVEGGVGAGVLGISRVEKGWHGNYIVSK